MGLLSSTPSLQQQCLKSSPAPAAHERPQRLQRCLLELRYHSRSEQWQFFKKIHMDQCRKKQPAWLQALWMGASPGAEYPMAMMVWGHRHDKLHLFNLNTFCPDRQTDVVLHPTPPQPSSNAGSTHSRHELHFASSHSSFAMIRAHQGIALQLNPIPHRAPSFPWMPHCFFTLLIHSMPWFLDIGCKD